jgi:hypothetical protein
MVFVLMHKVRRDGKDMHELLKDRAWRSHRSFSHELIKAICRWCNPKAKEQQSAYLTVNFAGVVDLGFDALDFESCFSLPNDGAGAHKG